MFKISYTRNRTLPFTSDARTRHTALTTKTTPVLVLARLGGGVSTAGVLVAPRPCFVAAAAVFFGVATALGEGASVLSA